MKIPILRRETVKKKEADGYEYEQEVDRLLVDKIPAKGFIYVMYVDFKKDFNLKNYVVKTFGQPKAEDIYKKGDEYHFFDMQWTKKVPTNCYGSSAHFMKATLELCNFSAELMERNGGWTELISQNLTTDIIKNYLKRRNNVISPAFHFFYLHKT